MVQSAHALTHSYLDRMTEHANVMPKITIMMSCRSNVLPWYPMRYVLVNKDSATKATCRIIERAPEHINTLS